MIRVSVFSNDLCLLKGAGADIYIGQSVQHEPLDQTDLKDDIDAT